jgi:predicted Zn finger-like uncharacterized protein
LFASAAGEYHVPMRIVCPSCAAAYEVPEARVVPGQSVRCARCGTSWTPVAGPQPATEAALPRLPTAGPVPLPQPTPTPATPTPARPTPSDAQIFSAPNPFAGTPERPGAGFAGGAAVLAGWVVSVAAVVGLGWAAVTWRNDIMHVWPPSERLYSTLGLMAGR